MIDTVYVKIRTPGSKLFGFLHRQIRFQTSNKSAFTIGKEQPHARVIAPHEAAHIDEQLPEEQAAGLVVRLDA